MMVGVRFFAAMVTAPHNQGILQPLTGISPNQ